MFSLRLVGNTDGLLVPLRVARDVMAAHSESAAEGDLMSVLEAGSGDCAGWSRVGGARIHAGPAESRYSAR